ncbi:MAG: RidA family protein [Negativicutes bacterium]|nr:RidA family protein [Negativicutes bacterium]
MSNIENRLKTLGIVLPPPAAPLGIYRPAKQIGNLIYTSGCGSRSYIGRVGSDFSIAVGQAAAREAVLNCLAAIQSLTGDLDRVEEIWKLLGFIRSAAGFSEQPNVLNGASQLLLDLFGEAGQHARSAIGVSELPEGIAVEIEMIVKVRD